MMNVWLYLGLVPVTCMAVATIAAIRGSKNRHGMVVDSLIVAAMWALGMGALWVVGRMGWGV